MRLFVRPGVYVLAFVLTHVASRSHWIGWPGGPR